MYFSAIPVILFSAILGVGASIGLLRILWKIDPFDQKSFLTAGLVTLFGALIGARIGFAITHIDYFEQHLSELIRIDSGGLSWVGAFVGGLLFVVIFSFMIRKQVAKVLDVISLMLLPLGVAAWLWAWVSGVAYGAILKTGTWWGMYSLDETGLVFLRVPIQLAAAITLIITLVIVEQLTKNIKIDGVKITMVGLAFSIHALVFSFMRADSTLTWKEVRVDSVAAMISTLGFLGFLGIKLLMGRNKNLVPEAIPFQER